MSSMRAISLVLLLFMAFQSVPARCQDGSEWDRARQQLITGQRGNIGLAIDRWKMLTTSNGILGFDSYASFVLAYPGFPDEEKLRTYAEQALDRESPDLTRLVAYFDRFPAADQRRPRALCAGARLTAPARGEQRRPCRLARRPDERRPRKQRYSHSTAGRSRPPTRTRG
jgi:soluble lytic murein transglycosylase